MQNLIQNPQNLIFENLFFFLSLGKFDTILTKEYPNYVYEEFLIVSEPWKDHLSYFEEIIPILLDKEQEKPLQKVELFTEINFVIYTSPMTGYLIGLGIRFFMVISNPFSLLNLDQEHRLQKTMYLLSRGILNSNFHQISQLEIHIPV
ncbi:hypothetical protein [Candidatus Hodarchaeum mangrovi]